MKKIVFLASADAQKPEILMKSFYECSNRNPSNDILLTNDYIGNVVEYAKTVGMKVIINEDAKFTDNNWIEKNLSEYKNDFLVSCGWPFKIPREIFENFFAALNCHGSYLPDYRGSRAYMHYWANCAEYFGATIHYINENFDDGNILIRGKQKLFLEESQNIIFERTAELCGHLLVSALMMAEAGNIGFCPNGEKRYFFKRTPEEFENYRKENEKRILKGENIVLTPHKILE